MIEKGNLGEKLLCYEAEYVMTFRDAEMLSITLSSWVGTEQMLREAVMGLTLSCQGRGDVEKRRHERADVEEMGLGGG